MVIGHSDLIGMGTICWNIPVAGAKSKRMATETEVFCLSDSFPLILSSLFPVPEQWGLLQMVFLHGTL